MRKLNLVFLAILSRRRRLRWGHAPRARYPGLAERVGPSGTRRGAESGHDLEKTEQALREYLNFRREDGPAWELYARVVDERDVDRRIVSESC